MTSTLAPHTVEQIGGSGEVGGSPEPGSCAEGSVVNGPGERLVTVLVTLAVPAEADAEDAAGLIADAAVSTALEVVAAAGVEGHLPVPGSLVVRRDGGQPWRWRRCQGSSQP